MFKLPDRLDYTSDLKKVRKIWQSMKKKEKPNIGFALWIVMKYQIIKAVLPFSICVNILTVNSFMIGRIIRYVNGEGDQVAHYIVIYSFLHLTYLLLMNFTYNRSLLIIGRMRSILTELIYEKLLNSSINSIQGDNRGKITNLVAADLERIDLALHIPLVFSIPAFVIGTGVLLWFNLGISGIIGLAIVVLHLPINFYLGKIVVKFRSFQYKFENSRMGFIINLIQGIRVIKLYGWENPYLNRIFAKRGEEINQAKKSFSINCLIKCLNTGVIGLAVFVTFSIYVTLGNTIDPSSAFSSITILVIMSFTIIEFGSLGIAGIFQLREMMERVTKHLIENEKLTENSKVPKDNSSILLKSCSFQWNEDEIIKKEETTKANFCLSNLNFSLKPGELMIVLGEVKAGKSSLLMSLMQEIHKTSGSFLKNGSFSFASQEPWVISGTIKQNILMGNEKDDEFYDQVTRCCCLDKDFELFSEYGDETMIGDQGVTLSGGQKARVSLARAIYANKDIILLDDPLSAVDPEVCFHLFHSCIKGLLKEKTVILATHQDQFISQADKILLLKEGFQVFFGTYDELINSHLYGNIGKVKNKEKASIEDEFHDENKSKNKNIQDKISIVDEELKEGHVPLSIYKRFWLLGYKHYFFILLTLIFQFIGQIPYLAIFYWISLWSKSSNQDSASFIYIMGAISGIYYLAIYFKAVSLYIPLLDSCKLMHDFALKSLSYTRCLYFDQNPTGRMLNRLSKDISQADSALLNTKVNTIFIICSLLGNYVIAIIILPYISIVFLIALIYVILMAKYFSTTIKKLKRLEQNTKSPILSLVNASIDGLVTIRSQDLQKNLKNDLKKAIKNNYKSYCALNLLNRTLQLYLDLGPSFIGILNMIIIVSLKDSIPAGEAGEAGISISLTSSIGGFTGFLFKLFLETDNYMTCVQRLAEYQDLKTEGDFENHNNFKITDGKIEVRNLSMKYRKNYDYALKNLNFTIEAGMKTGVIGRTGAGKSSILQILFRLTNPESGTIFIDGQDYLEAGLHDLRKQMSVIPQAATLFNASLRNNLDPFHEHSDKEIKRVLKQARLEEFLNQGLDDNFDSHELSAGKKQLVCLARAILKNSKIVMIDEATANVDNETDIFIQNQLNEKFKGSTLIVIAHRLRTIIDSDWIVVMQAGRCIEEGSPRDLINKRKSQLLKMIHHTGKEESQYLISKIMNSKDME